jgi:hypothetical protein
VNDDLARALQSLDPGATVTDTRSEEQIRADLEYVKTAPRRVTRTWPRIAVPTVAAGAAIIAIVAGLLGPFGHPPGHAATPPMLALHPSNAALGDVVDRARSQLRNAGGDAARRASFEGWYLQTEVEERTTRISPQRHDVAWDADLSGVVTVTAGETYPAESATDAPEPGSVIQHDEFQAGQMPVLFTSEPPETAAGMREYLALALGAPATDSVAYLSAARVLLSEWTLSGDQHAALLEGLTRLPRIQVAGDVVDRLGRPGVALRVTSSTNQHFEYLAILSAESGELIAVETIYLGGLDELRVESPCVTDYIAWT